MKKKNAFITAVALAILSMTVASCALVNKILPPGQAKKITGQQSASGKK